MLLFVYGAQFHGVLSHASAILKTSNECFYDNELKVEADVFLREQFYNWEHLPKRGFPVIFHGVKGEDQREENSPSYFNPQEASEVSSHSFPN